MTMTAALHCGGYGRGLSVNVDPKALAFPVLTITDSQQGGKHVSVHADAADLLKIADAIYAAFQSIPPQNNAGGYID